MKKEAQIKINSLLFFVLVFVPIYLGMDTFEISKFIPFAVILAFFVILVTFIKTELAIFILALSMLFSPEIELLSSTQFRPLTIRIDDIIIICTFLSWLAKVALNRQLGLLRKTALNKPIASYISVCILATLWGGLKGNVRLYSGFFFVLKYIEYFMVYFLVANNVYSIKQAKRFVFFILITAVIMSLYGYSQFGTAARVTAPFEGRMGEPNTLGGYLLFISALCLGLFAYSNLLPIQAILGGLIILIFPVFLKTYSRGSYFAFIPMWLAVTILTKRKKALLLLLFISGLIFGNSILPHSVKARIHETFIPGKYFEIGGRRVTLDYSASARIGMFKDALEAWPQSPFLGKGITGAGFIDGEFPMILAETGILGLLVFVWLIIAIFRNSLYNLTLLQDRFSQGLIVGFLGGLVGLLVHSFSASTFIIVRIMEPFWFIAAIASILPEIQKQI